jgi:hypothetical protein
MAGTVSNILSNTERQLLDRVVSPGKIPRGERMASKPNLIVVREMLWDSMERVEN